MVYRRPVRMHLLLQIRVLIPFLRTLRFTIAKQFFLSQVSSSGYLITLQLNDIGLVADRTAALLDYEEVGASSSRSLIFSASRNGSLGRKPTNG